MLTLKTHRVQPSRLNCCRHVFLAAGQFTVKKRPLREAIAERFSERNHYRGFGTWPLSLYDRVLRRYPWLPLPWRGRLSACRIRPLDEPVYVRLGTTDWLVLHEIFIGGEYETVVGRLQSPEHILDLGANIGLSVRYWLHFFPDAKVIAVEPDPRNFACLERNLAGYGGAKLVQACVLARRRAVEMPSGQEAWSGRVQDSETGTLDSSESGVAVVTLDELLGVMPADQRFDFLKCDIEGAEEELFSDCRAWIHRVDHFAVETHVPYSAVAFFSDLKQGGVVAEVSHHKQGERFEVVTGRIVPLVD